MRAEAPARRPTARGSGQPGSSLAVPRYVEQFLKPVEAAVETHFKIAEIYQRKSDTRVTTARWNRSSRSMRRPAASARRARASSRAARRWCWPAAGLRELRLAEAPAAVRAEPGREAASHERRDGSVRAPRRLPGRRDHRRRDVLPRRNLRRLQPRAARVGAAGGAPQGAKLQEYEDALDEEAFPFEEKAIKVHEKNLELMSGDHLYNSWIEKSPRASPS